MKKLLFIFAVVLMGCTKEPEFKCIECTEIAHPKDYIPTYCADVESADEYMAWMNKQKKSGVLIYKCQEKGN